MGQPLSGPGLGLPLPQNLYPTALNNAPLDFATNRIGLAAGDALTLPAGDWYLTGGNYSVMQYLDPLTNSWSMGSDCAWTGGVRFIKSDGFTSRIANMTACPIGAEVTNGGSNYVQGSTTVTPTTGNSTWSPIVGGQLSITSLSVNGSGYGIAPLVFIAAPPGPSNNSNSVGGMAAFGYSTINAGGCVTTITLLNPGAGYPSVPTIAILPDPFDPNLSSTTAITAATVVATVVGSGQITGVICTNPGAPLSTISTLTLTPGGVGSTAAISPIVMQTVTGISVTTAGTGYSVTPYLTTSGGVPTASTYTNPSSAHTAFRPRPAQIALTTVANSCVSGVSVIYDGGLFEGTPLPLVLSGAAGGSSAAVVTLTMGSVTDFIGLQPAP